MRSLLFCLLTLPATAFGEGWALNVYGLSYHPDREAARAAEVNNEFNPGLALRYGMEQRGLLGVWCVPR